MEWHCNVQQCLLLEQKHSRKNDDSQYVSTRKPSSAVYTHFTTDNYNVVMSMCTYMYVCAGGNQLSPMPLRRKTRATVAASNHSHAGVPLCQYYSVGVLVSHKHICMYSVHYWKLPHM